MPPSNLLNRRAPSMPPFLFALSTAGHFILLLFFFVQLELPQMDRREAAGYTVALVNPAESSAPSRFSGPVFPPSAEKSRPTDSELTETTLVERIPQPITEASPRIPPGLSDPKDCLLKKVNDVCPEADLSCISNYVAYCVRMY